MVPPEADVNVEKSPEGNVTDDNLNTPSPEMVPKSF